jgi:phytanoyl-CoA hydroxylase
MLMGLWEGRRNMETREEQLWLDEEREAYPPDLYRYSVLASGIQGFGAFQEEHGRCFRDQGYLVIHDAFAPPEVDAALEGLLDLIQGKHPGFKGIQFEAAARELLPSLSPEEGAERQDAVRKFWRFVEYESRLKALSEHPPLLEVLRRLMEDEPELFQDMALLKPPRIGGEKPWHQDHAYFNLPLGTTVIGVWIALDDATPENGCMRILPGSHRRGPVVHFKRRDWQICDSHVSGEGITAVPLRRGDCLLFHCLLHHGTPANRTPLRRRALQFHYKPASAPSTSSEERLAIFGSEGKDVAC